MIHPLKHATALLMALIAGLLIGLPWAWQPLSWAASAPPALLTATPTPAPVEPVLEQVINLGLPAGNGANPRDLALDSTTGQLYILTEGLPILQQGNGLSVYDTKQEEFTHHIKLNNGPHTALDVQVDPIAGQVYALWQAPYPGLGRPTLTSLSTQTLQVTQELPNVQAFFAAEGLLYTLETGQLKVYAISADGTLNERQQVSVTFSDETGLLVADFAADRLYLARANSGLWQIDIYTLITLTQVGAYTAQGQILRVLPNPWSEQVFVVENRAGTRQIYRLSIDGQVLEPPVVLDQAYRGNDVTLSPDGLYLYFSRETTDFAREGLPLQELVTLTTADLQPVQTIPLLTPFEALVIDARTNEQAYALYSFDHLLYTIDLAGETYQTAYTAIELKEMALDPVSGDLFLSDTSHHIRRLAGDRLAPLAEIRLPQESATYGRRLGLGDGELKLDPTRNRLYFSGWPAYVLEADSLAFIETFPGGGQFALAPGDNQVYLSNCGVTVLAAQTLMSQTILPGSRPSDQPVAPNPCVSYSQFDGVNRLLYSLAPNGVPGSNGGNLLYVYDLSLEPALIFTGADISANAVQPDLVRARAFVSYQYQGYRQLRTAALTSAGAISYTAQLSSLSGQLAYSPATNRLYVSDGQRLFVLEAGTLNVIGATPLPPNYDYRLIGLDPTTERLYLAGYDGHLLIANGNPAASPPVEPSPSPGMTMTQVLTPAGPIWALEALPDGTTLAVMNAGDELTPVTRLFATADAGATWVNLSRAFPPDLSVQAVAASTNYTQDRTLFVALSGSSGTGGLYRSSDDGQTWRPAMTGLRDLSANRLFLSPNFGGSLAETKELILANTIYAGLHTSLDSGQTWQPLSPPQPDHLTTTTTDGAAAVSSTGIVLAGQNGPEVSGVLRATLRSNGTLSPWQKVLDASLALLAIAPDGQTGLGLDSSLWRSTDGGRSWQPGGAGLTGLDTIKAHRFLFSPNFREDQTVYLFFQDISGQASGRLFRSTDGGQTWQSWDNPPRSKRFTAVTLTLEGDFLFGDDTAQLTRLSPATLTWAEVPPPIASFPLDDVVVSPSFAQDQTLFAVSHQYGLFRSTNGGRTWTQTGFPVRSTSFNAYQLAISPGYDRDRTLFVATGFSLHRSTDGGQTWQSLSLAPRQSGFKAGRVALSPAFATDRTIVVSTPAGLVRSTDGGSRWQIVLPQPEAAGSASVLIFDPANRTLYAWFDYDSTLYVSTDSGARWQARPGSSEDLFTVTTATVSPQGILTLRPDFNPQFLQISRQGQNRRALTGVLPAGLSDVRAMVYTSEGQLLIGGLGGLFQSHDNGQTWQPVTTNLPDGQAISLLRRSGSTLLAVLETGDIYISDNEGNTWQNVSIVR